MLERLIMVVVGGGLLWYWGRAIVDLIGDAVRLRRQRRADARARAANGGELPCTCSAAWMHAHLRPSPWCRAEAHPFVIGYRASAWTRLYGPAKLAPPKGVSVIIGAGQ